MSLPRALALLSLGLTSCLQYEGARCAALGAEARVADRPTGGADLAGLPPLTRFDQTANGYGQRPIAKSPEYACCLESGVGCTVDCGAWRQTLSMVRLGAPYDGEACVHGGPVGWTWCSVIFSRETGRVVATQHLCQD